MPSNYKQIVQSCRNKNALQTNDIWHFGNSWFSGMNDEAKCAEECRASDPPADSVCSGSKEERAENACDDLRNTNGRFQVL